ncbi:DUF3489 domain-containing protein [Sphingobium sp. B12D2B]|uniref:DUF3489 domain-containing protein n=1 Tax=Sphingobium sp. B12D2B TaxID=2940577 RepID=UPI0022250E18|nr:DUF3489 domain-containing protein [Sphingobium sp. B12D2B]MCW2349165.1 hypothetical protein [Sphingobium sp. B12D2B]
MTKSTRLTDLQLILLSTASARPDGNLLPLPDSIGGDRDRADKAIVPLFERGLVEERAIEERGHCWREHDDERIGLFISHAGIALIAPEADNTPPDNSEAADPRSLAPTKPSKTALVLDLLRREGGASIDELIAATGWLPHTTRAALTGLRKKGHAVVRDKIDGATCYLIMPVLAE